MAAPFDPEGLSTVPEVPARTTQSVKSSLENGTITTTVIDRRSGSKNASVNSSFARSFNESTTTDPPPVPHGTEQPRAQHAEKHSEGKLKKADRRKTIGIESTAVSATNEKGLKRGGLRNTIRRIFGRKSEGNRISLPTGPVVHSSDPQNPQDFITVAAGTHEPVRKIERSASLPSNAFMRSSGLSSHPPSMPPSAPIRVEPISRDPSQCEEAEVDEPDLETAPTPPVTVPNSQAEAGPGVVTVPKEAQKSQEGIDAGNIGFAITNGSNPRRRSRSVGEFRGPNHRMSPIQWHHLRTRSDEQLYFRSSRELLNEIEAEAAEISKPMALEHVQLPPETEFNFGLQDGGLEDNERIGLEERLVTLEIKLMDLEYKLSRLQAGSSSILQRDSRYTHNRQPSVDTNQSLSTQSGFSNHSPIHVNSMPSQVLSNNRPTSVATTLKAGQHSQHNSFWKPTGEPEKRVSLSALTIEHYTTLVTLIRREQAARMRLEEQLSQMQSQLDNSHARDRSTPYFESPRPLHRRDLSSSSRLSPHLGMLSGDGRRGGVYMYDKRARGSSYSTNETDTEDDYHDAHVTHPSITSFERGEYERGAFNKIPGVEDGEAF